MRRAAPDTEVEPPPVCAKCTKSASTRGISTKVPVDIALIVLEMAGYTPDAIFGLASVFDVDVKYLIPQSLRLSPNVREYGGNMPYQGNFRVMTVREVRLFCALLWHPSRVVKEVVLVERMAGSPQYDLSALASVCPRRLRRKNVDVKLRIEGNYQPIDSIVDLLCHLDIVADLSTVITWAFYSVSRSNIYIPLHVIERVFAPATTVLSVNLLETIGYCDEDAVRKLLAFPWPALKRLHVPEGQMVRRKQHMLRVLEKLLRRSTGQSGEEESDDEMQERMRECAVQSSDEEDEESDEEEESDDDSDGSEIYWQGRD